MGIIISANTMRNLVALLFASYITMDQFAAANAEASG